jgi:predicted DNA-binding transcriptional regulator AlpA
MQQLFTPQTLADYLGLSVQTVYNRLSRSDDLPLAISIGRLPRWRPQDVEAWLAKKADKVQTQVVAPVLLECHKRRRGRPTKHEQIVARGRYEGS